MNEGAGPVKLVVVFCAIVMLSAGVARGADAVPPPGEPLLGDSTRAGERPSIEERQKMKEEMERIGTNKAFGDTQWEQQKSARTAVLLSALYPGLGQLYNGRRWKTVIYAGLGTVMLANAIILYKESVRAEDTRDTYPDQTDEWDYYDQLSTLYREDAISFLWWYGAVWFIGMLDAYVDAHLYDVREVKPDFKLTPEGGYLGATFRF